MSTASIQEAAEPLRTLDPASADDSDLDAVRRVVGDARVVCLGESAHFTSELTRLRDRLLRFLVRELGFSAFVLESGLPEGLMVDDWVRGGRGDLAEIARREITYDFGRCAEMHAQLQWMREWNSTHEHQVGFYGMDVPGWCGNPAAGVAACLERIPSQPGDRELLARVDLGGSMSPSPEGDAVAVPTGLSEGVAALVTRARAANDDIAVQCARGAQYVCDVLNNGLYPETGRNLRNEAMTENLRWLLQREHKVLVGGHNVHLQRAPSFDGTAPIGALLTPELGSDLVLIGTTRGAGIVPNLDRDAQPSRRFATPAGEFSPPPHSLDALLDSVDHPHHLVDLRRRQPQALAAATAMSGQTTLIDLDPRQAFDAIIHVRHIHPAHGTTDLPPQAES